jgi:flagellar motor switch protein FliG
MSADSQFIKTPEPGNRESKFRRAAKFLILIGSEEAARILPRLEPEQIEAISREIASIQAVGPEEREEILEEFKSLLSSPYRFGGTSFGGPETARRILYAALGAEKGEALLEKVLPFSGKSPFAFLEDLKPEQISFLLKEETPAVSALILSRLSPKLSAKILAASPPQGRTELTRRIAKGGQVPPEVLGRIAEVLKEKALTLGQAAGGEAQEIDGAGALAEILRHGDYSFGGRILQELEDLDPTLGRDLRDRMLSLDDAAGMDDRVLQEKLRTMGDRDIALLLKGKDRNFTEKLLSNVSAERRLRIREEGELMGPIPRRDTEEAARNFLDWLWKEGPQVLSTAKDVYS